MKKKHMLGMFAIMALFILAGCSGPRIIYNKPGLTTNEFNRDKYACIQQSQQSWSAGGSGAAGGLMIMAAQADANNRQQALFKMCMEARGYTAQVETEDSDEERDRKKQYFIQATEMNAALKDKCKNDKYELLFKKSACQVDQINLPQLADKSFASEEEKATLLKYQTELVDITGKRRKLVEIAPDAKTKQNIILSIEMDKKNEINDLNMYEGKICWGDYNKNRKENSQVYMDQVKQIYSK